MPVGTLDVVVLNLPKHKEFLVLAQWFDRIRTAFGAPKYIGTIF